MYESRDRIGLKERKSRLYTEETSFWIQQDFCSRMDSSRAMLNENLILPSGIGVACVSGQNDTRTRSVLSESCVHPKEKYDPVCHLQFFSLTSKSFCFLYLH